MDKGNAFVVGVIVAVIAGVYFLAEKTVNNHQSNGNASSIPVSGLQSDWKTYENTKYDYEISYPKGISIGSVQEEDRATAQTTAELSAGNLEIAAGGSLLSVFQSNPSLDRGKLSDEDAASLAQTLWQSEKDDPNTNIQREISDVTETTFASTKAYTFTEKQSYTARALQEAVKNNYPSFNRTYTFFFLKNPSDGYLISVSATNDAIAQQMLKTFAFTHNKMAGIPPQDTWLSYENTAHHYRINYPPNSDDIRVDPYPDEYTRIRPAIGDTIQVPTPRGTLGIWSLNSTSTAVHMYQAGDQQDAVNRTKYLSSLDLKSFVEALCSEQAQRASKIGPNPNGYPSQGFGTCRANGMQEEVISGQKSYTLDIIGRLDTLLVTVLVPGLLQEYKYTFFENKKGEKVLVWYPADEPVFKEIISSFEFTNSSTAAPTKN